MAVKLGNGNWAVKEDKLLAYNDNSGLFFNKEFDFTRGSTATYVGRDGLIASAASGVPRIDFTNDTKGHLLLEPSSTNLVTDSSGGLYGNAPASEILTTAPDGTNTAVRPVPDSNSDRYEYSINGNTYSTDTKITYSWYRKRISTPDDTQYTGDLRFNVLVNCTQIGSTTEIASNINGYDRFSATFNITDGTQLTRIRAYFGYSIGIGNSSIAYWGHQVEALSYSTSLIYTTGAASTRNADVCNNSGSAQDFNSEEGVLYAEVASLAEDIGGSKNFSISDGTNNNGVKFAFRTAGSQIGVSVKSNGTTTANNVYNMPVSNFFKVAFKYKTNDCALWVNGTEIATDTSAAMPLDLSSLRFDRGDNGNKFNGKVRNLQVFTEALTDEQLQKLTS